MIEAARLAAAGADADAVLARVSELQPHCGVALTLDTLDYLHKGGRIGRAQHMIGSLLRFRPVLHLDNGELAPLARPRTPEEGGGPACWSMPPSVPGAMNWRWPASSTPPHRATLRSCAGKLKLGFGSASFTMGEIGPAIGSHVGPGTVGLCFRTQ